MPAAAWAPAITAAALWPGLEQSFFTPKLWALGLLAVLATAQALTHAHSPSRPLPVWAVLPLLALGLATATGDAVRLEAVARETALWALFLAALVRPPPWGLLVRWTAFAGAFVSAVACLQAVGVDPLAALGPTFTGARMHVYGTLGNPDAVAALVGATVWLAAHQALRAGGGAARLRWAFALALHLGALAATRSFATVLGVVAASAWLVSTPGFRAWRDRAVAGGVVAAALACAALGVAGRAGDQVVAGRLHLMRVAAVAIAQAPVLGHGPGAVAVRWSSWETRILEASPEAVGFAGAQRAAHNDYLERWAEQGLLGGLALVVILSAALRGAWRSRHPAAPLAGAALVSLAARAWVDFPLARPAEACLFVVLAAVLSSTLKEKSA